MKKTAIIATCVFLLSLKSFALEFPFPGKVTEDEINLRAGPNTNYESLGKLKKGQELRVVLERYNWYKVALPESVVCFISSKYVKRIDRSRGIVTGNRVNLRARPADDATILGQLNKNQQVEVVKVFRDWYGIRAPSDLAFGWVHNKFIKEETKKEETAAVVLEEEMTNAQKEEFKPEEKIVLKPVASGKIYPMGIFWGRRGTHKLINKGKVIYYLKGDKLLLNNFVGYEVNIFGKIIDNNKKIPLINVERIENLPVGKQE